MTRIPFLLVLALAACSEKNPNYCATAPDHSCLLVDGGALDGNGDSGHDSPANPTTAATGGIANGGDGGAGFAQGSLATSGNLAAGSDAAGGGGGGGGGYILTSATLTGATASPTPVLLP